MGSYLCGFLAHSYDGVDFGLNSQLCPDNHAKPYTQWHDNTYNFTKFYTHSSIYGDSPA